MNPIITVSGTQDAPNMDTQTSIAVIQTLIANKQGEITALQTALTILQGTFTSQATDLENQYKWNVDNLTQQLSQAQIDLVTANATIAQLQNPQPDASNPVMPS
jgi:hypothetical protein